MELELEEAVAREDWATAEELADQLHPPRPMPRLGNAALWYADAGLWVFPIQPGGKKPYARTQGLHDATTDQGRIRRWWSRHPDSNIGIATGHRVDVIDFDGAQAHAAWGEAFPNDDGSTYGGASVLATVSTPRPGGLHVYIRATGEGNHAGSLPGVDFRGRGGYVLAPPSALDNRPGQYPGTYRFARDLNPKDL